MGNTTNRAKGNAKKAVSMERVLDARESAILAKVATLREVAKGAKVNTDFWSKDITYVMGFGDIDTATSRCTLWVTSRKVYCDYGNTNKVLFNTCEDFAKSHSDKVKFSTNGISTKVEKRFTTDMDTATELIKALIKATATTGKASRSKASKATEKAVKAV